MEDWEDFVTQCEDLLLTIDDLPARCNAAGGWVNTVEGMMRWAEEHEHVTDKMEEALINIQDAVEAWAE